MNIKRTDLGMGFMGCSTRKNDISVFRMYNENVCDKERADGSISSEPVGFRWYVTLNGELVGDPYGYETRKEAVRYVKKEIRSR